MLNKIFNFRNLGIGFTGGASLLTYAAWAEKAQQEKAISEIQSVVNELKIKIDNGDFTGERLVQAKIYFNNLNNNLENYKSTLNNFKGTIEKLPAESPVTNELKNHHSAFTEIHNSMDNSLQKALEFINDPKKNFLENLDQLINNYKEFLLNLDLDQLCQLLTITSSSLILICLLNIIIIYFANRIIDTLNLEIRFPKLAKFLKLRKLYQNFYIYLNFLIILIFLILILYVNVYTFFIK